MGRIVSNGKALGSEKENPSKNIHPVRIPPKETRNKPEKEHNSKENA